MDYTIVLYLNQLAVSAPFLSGVAMFFAHYLPWLVSGAFVVFILTQMKHPTSILPLPPKDGSASGGKERQWGKRLKHIAEGLGAALLAWLGSLAFRLFVHRPRPFAADPNIIALVEKTSYSFPSGHAAFFFALSTVIYIYNKRAGMWFFVASSVIGLARIAAGVHYPTDILGGAVLGIAVGYAAARMFKLQRTVLCT